MRKYRSNLEKAVGAALGTQWAYEPFKVPYEIPKKYTPDFVYEGPLVSIFVEVKGYFRVGDTQKYKAIRDSLGHDERLVFFLQDPNKKVRKGSSLTMSQWCEKEGLEWYSDAEELKGMEVGV